MTKAEKEKLKELDRMLENLPRNCENCVYFEDWRGTLFPPVNLDICDGRCSRDEEYVNIICADECCCERYAAYPGGQKMDDSEFFVDYWD